MELIKRVIVDRYVQGYFVAGTLEEDGFSGEKYLGKYDIIEQLRANPKVISNAKLRKSSLGIVGQDCYDIVSSVKGMPLTKLPAIRIDYNYIDDNNCYNCSGRCFLRSKCWECYQNGKGTGSKYSYMSMGVH